MNLLRICHPVFLILALIIVRSRSDGKDDDPNQLVFVSDVVDDNRINNVNQNEGSKLTQSMKFAVSNTNPEDLFVPTSEWQEVGEHQTIPKGLHIRLNLQTGKKEAKLLDEKKTHYTSILSESSMPIDSKKFDFESFKQALKEIKDDGPPTELDAVDIENDSKIKSKYRDINEIRKDFNAMNLNIKTNTEIMIDLFRHLQNLTLSKAEKLEVLNEIEYQVHFFDNGALLCDIGAFKHILNELNDTKHDIDVMIKSIVVLGSAIQGNPKVQIYGLENNILQLILQLIGKNTNIELNTKLVYLLSAVLRHFPYAQVKFLDYGGLSTINDLLSDPKKPNKIKIKTLTLINDLILEKTNVMNETQNQEKVEQYKRVDVKQRLSHVDWCNTLIDLLQDSKEHDTIEKILESTRTLLDVCSYKFELNKIVKILNNLANEYKQLAQMQDTDDSYFRNLSELAVYIKDHLHNIKQKVLYQEEL